MRTVVLIALILMLSSCGVMKCGDVRREVEARPLWLLHPVTIPELAVEGIVCGEYKGDLK